MHTDLNVEREERMKEEDAAYAVGLAWLEKNQPAWAKAVIVAHEAVDESDIQTDYFNVRDGAPVILAWSRHTRDRFDEMRKAARRLSNTAHLGPGCDRYTARVVLQNDVRGNGAWYHAGQASPWHRELYGEHWDGVPLFTEREAATFLAGAAEPEAISVDETLVGFRWDIVRESVEHREKYSMGAGYYLRSGRDGGWTVEKWGLDEYHTRRIAVAIGRGSHILATL